MNFEDAPLLIDVMPDLVEDFTSRIHRYFSEKGETASLLSIRDQLPQLRIVATCSCQDEFCGSFYVSIDGQPMGPPSRDRRGHFLYDLDVIFHTEGDGRVYEVEIFSRPDLRDRRDALALPPLLRGSE